MAAFGSWRARRESKGIWKFKLLSRLSDSMLLFVIGGILFTFAAVIFFATQIPSPDDLTNREVAQATKIYDREGELLYDIYSCQNRTPIKLNKIREHVKKQKIPIKKKDFMNTADFLLQELQGLF